MTLNHGEKELFRAKEENFQDLLDYKRSIKGALGGGRLTVRHDLATGEWVLIHADRSWPGAIMENTAKLAPLMDDFEEYLAKEVMA